MIDRRGFLVGIALLAACKREERCKHCGMKIDKTSAWYTEVGDDHFDTPRCAFTYVRAHKMSGVAVRVREYYDASGPLRDGSTLRFIAGGDVVGPMGPDLVPVEPSRASKFIQDHGADHAYTLDEITPEVLASLK